jgi:DNA polymerase epsilon subunit 1
LFCLHLSCAHETSGVFLGRNEPLANIKRYWKEIYAHRQAHAISLNATAPDALRSDDQASTMPPEVLEFSVRSVATLRAAGRPLQQLLLAYLQEKHGPTLLVVQSPLRTQSLAAVAAAVSDFPVIRAPTNSKSGRSRLI